MLSIFLASLNQEARIVPEEQVAEAKTNQKTKTKQKGFFGWEVI